MPTGSQVIIGSFPSPPATARGPYTGFAASNLVLPQAVIGGVSLLIVRTRFVLVQVPVRSCASCGTGAGACAKASDERANTMIDARMKFRIPVILDGFAQSPLSRN